MLNQDDFDLFFRLMAEFASLGATKGGGVCRLACSSEDKEARDYFARILSQQLDVQPQVDLVGNMFGIVETSSQDAPMVLAGSHLDSQPTGGRFDGTLGVVAAIVATKKLQSMRAAASFRSNIGIVNWTNEEGARFQPSLSGSGYFSGRLGLSTVLGAEDVHGITLGAALTDIGYNGQQLSLPKPIRALELHIEQGDALEKSALAVGVVEAGWAAVKLSVSFKGEAAHTGPTPRWRRKDALQGASRGLNLFYELADLNPDATLSAAALSVYPNSPNVIPAEVNVSFEFRSEYQELCVRIAEIFQDGLRSLQSKFQVDYVIVSEETRQPVLLDSNGVGIAELAASRLKVPIMRMKTVAGHDALALQKRLPSTLIFVQTTGGLSHNEKEHAPDAALVAGLQVYASTLHSFISNCR